MKAQIQRVRKTNVSVVKKDESMSLDSVIRRTFPLMKKREARDVQAHIIDYISRGIADGYDVALIKRETNQRTSNEELKLKILKLWDKK